MTGLLLAVLLAQLPPLPGSAEQRQHYEHSFEQNERLQERSRREFEDLRRQHEHEDLEDAIERDRRDDWE
jgi:hypothetical protein